MLVDKYDSIDNLLCPRLQDRRVFLADRGIDQLKTVFSVGMMFDKKLVLDYANCNM